MTHETPGGERRATPPSGSGTSTSRWSTRDRRSGIAMTPQQLATRRAPGYAESPVAFLVAIGVSLTLAVLCLGVGLSRPLQRIVPQAAYSQAGHFTYAAPVTAATPVYPSGDTPTPVSRSTRAS